jgi:hypothetical protein
VQITVTQRGGFIGGEVTLVQLDTGRLGNDTRRGVEQEIDATLMSSGTDERPVGADLLEYRLIVEDQGRRRARTWTDDGGVAAAPIRDLLEKLQGL